MTNDVKTVSLQIRREEKYFLSSNSFVSSFMKYYCYHVLNYFISFCRYMYVKVMARDRSLCLKKKRLVNFQCPCYTSLTITYFVNIGLVIFMSGCIKNCILTKGIIVIVIVRELDLHLPMQ
jgi:hypothetical protein